MTPAPSLLNRLYSWLPLLPLLLLLAGAYWLNQQVLPLAVKADNSKRHDPDFIVSDFNALALDVNGLPQHRLAAHEMIHYPDDDSLHLERPVLTSLQPNRPVTVTRAQTGLVNDRGDEVFLRGDVLITRAAAAQSSERTYSTTYLHVLPNRDWADTDRPVVIADAHNLIHAVGMEMDGRAQITKLTQVSSQHEPDR